MTHNSGSSVPVSRPLLVVDGANVVGSVPDGWWRDRRGAAQRLRDRLTRVALQGIDASPGPMDVVLVVEGRARGVASVPDVRVVEASGSGDDTIVDLVAEHPDTRRVVVTADRELRARVLALGAEVVGPSALTRGQASSGRPRSDLRRSGRTEP